MIRMNRKDMLAKIYLLKWLGAVLFVSSVNANTFDEPLRLSKQNSTSGGLLLKTFSVATCNKTAPLQGTGSVSPDPIKIPGDVTVEFKGNVGVTVKSPTKTVLLVKKKVLDVWVEIPCVDNLGSCTYADGCTMIPLKPEQACPPPLSTYNIPCRCPFPAGTYSLPSSMIAIPDEHLPEFLTDGDYKVNVKLYDAQNDQLACFDIAFSLTT